MIKVLVVDDEKLSRDELKYLLGAYPELQVCGEASNGETALELYKRLQPDVVFLDIQMPGMGGLAVAAQLAHEEDPPVVVFATAYDKHAIQAFELNAVDYLLKPFSRERLRHTIRRLEKNRMKDERLLAVCLNKLLAGLEAGLPRRNMPAKITVELDERIIVLNQADVVFASVEGRHVYLKMRDRSYRTHYSLKELEHRLPTPPFLRCHRAYLVNFNWVKEIQTWFNGTYMLVLNDSAQTRVPVSRLHVKDMKGLLEL